MNQTTVTDMESSKRVAFNMMCSTAAHLLSAVIAFMITPFLIARVGLEAYVWKPFSLDSTEYLRDTGKSSPQLSLIALTTSAAKR